ncbi:hypothetical protein ACH5RR_015833 [Cinchona calisaya]|uniref:Uncharacterized protein n=1 Tax=Cinchona calisaya TaxID=153742 RepID=A0ABD2ZUA2_9GENT
MDGGVDSGSSSTSVVSVILSGNGESVPDLTGKVHQLPCCIKYDGPTTVSHYFKPKPTGLEIDGLGMEEAYFRGRKLQGTTVSLPQGYSGFVLGKKSLGKRPNIPEENPNFWEMKAKFQNFAIWNHDTFPSQDDSFLRAFHWFSIAKSLHQPVTAEDLESASISQNL